MGAAGYGTAAGLMVVGTAYSALAQDAAGVYNQAMAEYDTKQLDDLAADAINRGENEASRIGREGRRIQILPLGAGAKQQIFDDPAWLGVATHVFRTL